MTESNEANPGPAEPAPVTDSFFDICRDMLAIATPDGRLRRVNPSWERTLGWSQDEISSRSFLDFVHPDDIEHTRLEAERIFSQGRVTSGFINRYCCKDGHYVWLEWNSRMGPDGNVYCVARDVSARRLREERLEILERAVESTRCGLLITDAGHPENPINYVNRGFEKITGYRASEVTGRSCRLLQAGDRDQAGLFELRRAIRENAAAQVVLRNYRKDGTLFMNQLTITPVQSEEGNGRSYVGIVVDVTEQIRLAEELQLLMDRMPTSVLYVDPDYRVRFANEAYSQLVELPRQEITRRTLKQILTPEGWERARKWLRKAFDGFEHEVETKPGLVNRPHSVFRLRHVPEREPGGNVVGCLVLIDDVTDYKRMQDELDRQAHHDPLTGLLNSRGFERALDEAIEELKDDGCPGHVLCLVDLDRFKPINDNCGHEKGDEALKQVAGALRFTVRTMDPVARIGGDEFAVLLRNCSLAGARRSAEEIVTAIADLRIHGERHAYSMAASIGLAAMAETGDSAAFLRAADEACYTAKRAGGNCVRVSRRGNSSPPDPPQN